MTRRATKRGPGTPRRRRAPARRALGRRRIAAALAVAALLTGAAATIAALSRPQDAASAASRAPVRPPALRPGDTIALLAPASPVEAKKAQEAADNLARQGYKVKISGRLSSPSSGYLAATDEMRAHELDAAFADPEVSMILCLRGGYGTPRLLHLLDYAAMRRHPKILVGYSDITALHLAIRRRAGLVTFHGPMGEKDFSGRYGLAPYSTKHLWPLLASTEHESFEDWGAGAPAALGSPRTMTPGVAEGPLVGGNLSTVCALMGTPFEIETEDAILFLEDVNEEPFRIDRMLAQLEMAGKLREANGVLLGAFVRCEARSPRESFTIDEVLEEYFKDLGAPVLRDYPAGHLPDQATLPLGSKVRLDATRRRLSIIEAAVTPR